MKVVHLTKKFPPLLGGDAIVVDILRKIQSSKGHEVYVISSNHNLSIKDTHCRFNGIPMTSDELDKISFKRISSLIKIFFQSWNDINQIQPEVIHAHAIDLALIYSVAARAKNIPIVLTLHTGSFEKNKKEKTRWLLEMIIFKLANFKIITTVNNIDQNEHQTFTTIQNGVDRSIFFPTSKNNTGNILFVGRLETTKGIELLISAYEKLLKQGFKNKLVIVGEGSLFDKIKALGSTSVFRNNLLLIPQLKHEELAKYYSSSAITALPSTSNEGFGLTLLESIACGTPTIVTKLSGIAEFIEKTQTGIVLNEVSKESIFKSLESFLTNKDLRTRLRNNCENVDLEDYDWQTISKKYENLYLRAIE